MIFEVLVFMEMEQQCAIPENAHTSTPHPAHPHREREDYLTSVHPLEFPLPMRNIAISYHTSAQE